MTSSPVWIIGRHVMPAVMPLIVVSVVLTASRAVLSAAGLAFLGLGDPNTWSWGRILYEAQQSGAMSSAGGYPVPVARDPPARAVVDAAVHRLQRRPQPEDQERSEWQFVPTACPRVLRPPCRIGCGPAATEAGLDAVLTDDPEDVAYLTGFFHHPCERPVAVWLDRPTAAACCCCPSWSASTREPSTRPAELVSYPEYPGIVPPFAAAGRRGRRRAGGDAGQHRRRSPTPGSTAAARPRLSTVELVPTDLVTVARYVKDPPRRSRCTRRRPGSPT